MTNKMNIDVSFDFTEDSKGYWGGFWILGRAGCDPDSASATLQKYHQLLWSSKPLPNGEIMDLQTLDYLTWAGKPISNEDDMRFGSDSITTSFRYNETHMLNILQEICVEKGMEPFQAWQEEFIRATYTIGGMIIFPKKKELSINMARGSYSQPYIRDRFDRTLKCIKLYYKGEISPLFETLKLNKEFFDLFKDFKGYVDFFFLQDMVSSDYSKVKNWMKEGEVFIDADAFTTSALPQNIDEYKKWLVNTLDFVAKRNARIKEYVEIN